MKTKELDQALKVVAKALSEDQDFLELIQTSISVEVVNEISQAVDKETRKGVKKIADNASDAFLDKFVQVFSFDNVLSADD